MKNTNLNLVETWDKVFPKSEKVKHSKVTFNNRYGLTLAADMYIPLESAQEKSQLLLLVDRMVPLKNNHQDCMRKL